MTRYSSGVRILPFVALILLLALLAAPTRILAGGPSYPDPRHRPIQERCADGGICIDAFEPPVAPSDSVSITGYTSHATAERVMLTIVDPRTDVTLYSAFATSLPMVGDYAGYSAFRFTAPMTYPHGLRGFNEYLLVHVSTVMGKDSYPVVTGTSNEVQIWSPGFGL